MINPATLFSSDETRSSMTQFVACMLAVTFCATTVGAWFSGDIRSYWTPSAMGAFGGATSAICLALGGILTVVNRFSMPPATLSSSETKPDGSTVSQAASTGVGAPAPVSPPAGSA